MIINSVDVLILGAGVAGCATALGLMRQNVKQILLVDKPLVLPFRVGESATPDISTALARLGLNSDLAQLGHRPYHGTLSRWGDTTTQLDHFLLRGRGHGWHLDRAAFDSYLQQQVVTHGALLVKPADISHITADKDWRISVKNYGEILAQVVVDAGGRRAPLAQRLGIKRYHLDNLVALAVQTSLLRSNNWNGLALIEAFSDGWWYAASLPNGKIVITLMTDHDIAVKKQFYNTERYLQAWQQTELLAQSIPPPTSLTENIAVFAAHSGFVERAAGRNWLAVGDALLTFDPLTSSGIAGAFSDAEAAVPVIQSQLTTINTETSVRAYAHRANTTLQRYLSERQQHYYNGCRWPENEFWQRRLALGNSQ